MAIVELGVHSWRRLRRGETRFRQCFAFVRGFAYLRLSHFIVIIHFNKFRIVVAQLRRIRYIENFIASVTKNKIY